MEVSLVITAAEITVITSFSFCVASSCRLACAEKLLAYVHPQVRDKFHRLQLNKLNRKLCVLNVNVNINVMLNECFCSTQISPVKLYSKQKK